MFRPICLALFASLVLAGCGSDPAEVDTTPPSTVQDLAVVAETDTTVTLTWTAPGDDGDEGQAWEYDLRYGAVTLRENWETAVRVDSLPRPQPVGSAEEMLVTGLPSGSTHFFALKTGDDAGNWSEASNLAAGLTGDSVPPAATTDLVAMPLSHKAVQLTWTASGNDGDEGTAAKFYFRYSKSPITEESWAQATAVLGPTPGPAGTPQSFTVSGLDDLTTYYFALKTTDGFSSSPISNVAMTETPRDTVPPATITDLTVVSTGPTSATLSWTAPGDDGLDGTVVHYDLRTSEHPITSATWSDASPIELFAFPSTAGQPEGTTAYGLTVGTTHYFALRASDERGNTSGLSNVPFATLPAITVRRWYVSADGSGDAPTIQAAIDTATAADTVIVGPGRYSEAIGFRGVDIVLMSQSGPEMTIIDATLQNASVVTFQGTESRACIIEGFTLTGGCGTIEDGQRMGGGIMAFDASPTIRGNIIRGNNVMTDPFSFGGGLTVGAGGSRIDACPLIEGNVFQDNVAYGLGGALSIQHSTGTLVIRNNVFRGNRTLKGDGGAIFIWQYIENVVVENNIFVANVANDHGGAIAFWNSNTGYSRTRGNLFLRNTALGLDGAEGSNGTGGGIHASGVSGVIENNTFVGNDGTIDCKGGAIGLDLNRYNLPHNWVVRRNIVVGSTAGGIVCTSEDGAIVVKDNLLFNNAGCDPVACSSDVQLGNFVADPLFCDPANDDYRVRSDSPALTHPEGPIGAYATPGCQAPAQKTRSQ